ncbi:peptidoglycan glycosyltransferase [Calothrix brevissima NIES-22]|nr:peptidoglycan glycosyltransferase [Calothrix brevissima NIES-22]
MHKSTSRTKSKFSDRTVFKKRQGFRQYISNKLFTNSEKQISPNRNRLFVVWCILILAGLRLAINLYQLQIVQGENLTKRARNQQTVSLRPFTPRRMIVDRNNYVLAFDRIVYTLYAHPRLFQKKPEEIAKRLAVILNKNADELVKIFQGQKSGILLDSAVPEEIATQIFALHLNGLELTQKYLRFYPEADLTADVVGYINTERQGQAGVEYSQENLLARSAQTVKLRRQGNGALLPDGTPTGFLNLDDLRLQLTIDSRIQRIAQTALQQQVEKFRAKRGAVIVMDAWDGSLLALVSVPSYNPNKYSQADISLFKNWTVADLYEPGSTFKPLNVAIALETGVIKPDDMFDDPGFMRVADRTIKNAEQNRDRTIDIAQILQHSSNVGMVKIMQRLPTYIYYQWLQRLGLGQSINTDLPFAVTSQLKSQEKFMASPIEKATASFGQGFSLTALQLVQLHGALANGGKLVTPHVIKGLMDSQGQMHYSPTLPIPRQIFSPMTTHQVIKMMETVVDKGTGKASKISGYRIAGKTGTAQKANSRGGYQTGAYITSFLGILPAQSPHYVVLALVDEAQGSNAYGGTVAAPIVKSVINALIPLEQIPPSQGVN